MKKLIYIFGFLFMLSVSLTAFASNTGEDKLTEIYTESDAVKVYPNPFVSTITLEIDWYNHEATTVRIFNIIGKQIYTKNYNPLINKLSINTSTFEKGIYFIEIKKGNKIDTQRIVKQ